MKILGFIALIVLLFISLFKFRGAVLTNNVLGVAVMILLISLFSDLKEFNFWGLRGKKEERQINELQGGDAISEENAPKVDQKQIQEAQQQDVIQLMDTGRGNFLALAFEIERLLRISGTVILSSDIPSNTNPVKLTKMLKEKGLLTDSGEKQVESIRWLRNLLIHGREGEINQATIDAGIQLAHSFYQELREWLENPR